MCLKMVTKINLPNSAAIVGLVDPSEAIPYDMTVSVSALGKEGECVTLTLTYAHTRVFTLQYDGPPARGVLVEDTTKDQEDRKREEERLRASRPGTASRPASVAGGAGAGAGAGASLAAAAANLVGENSGTAVLRALGDKVCSRCQEGVCVAVSLIRFLCCRHPPQEKKLTEEELKNQLKYRTVLAVKNNKYEDVCAWWLVVLVRVAV